MELYEKSLNTLELPAVLALLSNEAVSDAAKEISMHLRPSSDAAEVRRRQGETDAARAMMVTKGSPAFACIRDVRPYLSRVDLGGVLNNRELLDIAEVLRSARVVRAYRDADDSEHTEIDFLFLSLHSNRFLEDKITSSIVGDDEIADAASAELADIRRHIRAENANIRETLQRMISSPSYSKALQEAIITQRSDRYVIPVKAEYKSSVPGLVHDISSSGATLFIEPMAVVKANNALRELRAREEQEKERVLMELSADCASFGDDIACDFSVLTELDFVFAKAKLSYALDACRPEITEREVCLRGARHPLLDRKTAVPIDLTLGAGVDTLVITGPNTGGKTVSLKTLGVLSVMHQCGLHIPAKDGSALPIFGKVLSDIGDEQSIEQSLSTFSAHMTNIVGILKECEADTLLLFDELGAGTDPVEGAALAVAIIEYARKTGAIVAATTHYAELKVYATDTPGVMNASCEFDVDTLRPTYRLLIGIPGKSNAFAISARLGLSEGIISDARNRVSLGSAALEETIEKLETQRQLLEKERERQALLVRTAEEDAKKAERMRRELEVRLEKAELKSRRDAERIISQAKEAADAAFAEIDEMRRVSAKDADAQRINEARAELKRKLNEAGDRLEVQRTEDEPPRSSSRPPRAGDTVKILSMGVNADVLSVNTDGTLELQAGIIKVTARPDEVVLQENAASPKKQTVSSGADVKLRAMPVSPEVDLRGMMTDEAIPVMERYIDSAVMAKLSTVTIIHGKGTGALRQAVQQELRRNKAVKSFRLGRYGEGETGVTVVELK